MSKNRTNTKNMVVTTNKACSTPENRRDSPSRDSDSVCDDSEAPSPVPFLCTQDGAEGETDVVWNYYTPKSDHVSKTKLKNSTPLSRKAKKYVNPKVVEKPLPKRRPVRNVHKKTELFQDLIELNQNLHELIGKKSEKNDLNEKQQSGSEDDIFNDSPERSPKSGLRISSRCLRKNLLSSKFSKPDTETALESDDSMNECLLRASQIVEEKLMKYEPVPAKRTCHDSKSVKNALIPELNDMDRDSMDAILHNIKLESPAMNKMKKINSPHFNNDSFDNLLGNLNDSALEQLTQMPIKNTSNKRNKDTDWTVKELIVHDSSPSTKFVRHSSMPESPTVSNVNKPSTSGMVFGRYNTMPQGKSSEPGDSPLKCTPDEIKRKHQQAREKLLAKRLLPFTSSQASQSILPTQNLTAKKKQFQLRVASSKVNKLQNNMPEKNVSLSKPDKNANLSSETVDLKLLIEKKRQEALMKLRRRQPQNKML